MTDLGGCCCYATRSEVFCIVNGRTIRILQPGIYQVNLKVNHGSKPSEGGEDGVELLDGELVNNVSENKTHFSSSYLVVVATEREGQELSIEYLGSTAKDC